MSTNDLAERACPGCRRPVFTEGSVVVCSACDAYAHQQCWAKARMCQSTAKCRGKPGRVAVVRLEPPHPTGAEIADIVDTRLSAVLHPLLANLRSDMAHGEDLENVRKLVADHSGRALAEVERVRREFESRIEAVRAVVSALDDRHRSAPAPVTPDEFARATAETTAGLTTAAHELRESVRAEVESMRAALAADLHGVLAAIEACRWDTAARRHKFPWDERTDDVLLAGTRDADDAKGRGP